MHRATEIHTAAAAPPIAGVTADLVHALVIAGILRRGAETPLLAVHAMKLHLAPVAST